MCDPPFRRGTFSSHQFYADDFIAQLLEGHTYNLRRRSARHMPDNSFRLFIKCKEEEASVRKEILYGSVVHDTFICDPGPDSSVPEDELPGHDNF
jgi:hypothetical protein